MISIIRLKAVCAISVILFNPLVLITSLLLNMLIGVSSYSTFIPLILSCFIFNCLVSIILLLNNHKTNLFIGASVYFVFFIIITHMVWGILFDLGTAFFNENFLIFLISSFVGIQSAYLIKDYLVLSEVFKLFNRVMIFMVFLVLAIFLANFMFNNSLIISNYRQPISYFGALSFGWYIFEGYKTDLIQSKILNRFISYKFFSIVMLIAISTITIISIFHGGRGALLLMLIYAAIWVYKNFSLSFFLSHRFLIVLILLTFYIYILNIFISSFLEENIGGFFRAISLFYSSDYGYGLNIAGGRGEADGHYAKAIAGIGESPLFGYGPMLLWDKVVHPHNIILEIFLQYGIPLGSLVIVFLCYMLISAIRVIDKSPILLVLICFLIIYLMISGSYLRTPLFWFLLSINYKLIRKTSYAYE